MNNTNTPQYNESIKSSYMLYQDSIDYKQETTYLSFPIKPAREPISQNSINEISKNGARILVTQPTPISSRQ